MNCMKKKYNILLIILLIVAAFAGANGQSLKFVRTDVDSSRSRFVTATYIFGFDILTEGLDSCTNVTFELRYDHTQFVHFSEWKKGNFGPSTKAYIMPLTDESQDFGRIVVSCGLDNMIDSAMPSNPRVITLKFSVIPAAPHFETINFSIFEPRATVWSNGIPQIVILPGAQVSYTIHSFVNVFPGDADNNGVVDHLDFSTISYYMGMGPNTKQMRSFRREPASTLWAPQPVIAWDTAAATYADADGNGEINMADNLVVTYNYDKRHPMSGKPSVEAEIFVPKVAPAKTSKSVPLPIYASTSQPYLAATGSFDMDAFEGYEIVGIEPTGLLDGDELAFAFYSELDGKFEFIAGTVDKSKYINRNGIIANLWLEPKEISAAAINPNLLSLKGISTYGNIFELRAFTSVEEKSDSKQALASYSNNLLHLSGLKQIEQGKIEIFGVQGELIFSTTIEAPSGELSIVLPNLITGCYFAKISGKEVYTLPFLVY